ncbi:unnamed protein product [Rhizophagus irregularis]|nr:unnamed protein product [Rhizophagus irregularis]
MGYEKLKEYYARTNDSYIYPIAMILDPRIKLKYYTQQKWEQEYIDASLKIIKETYNNNYKNTFQNTDSLVESVRNDFFCIFELDNNDRDEDELEEYLRKPAVAFKTDPLQWWKTHEATYPHLANMARDFLAIPGTSVPVERIFSGGTDLITKRRSSLGRETIQAWNSFGAWNGLEDLSKSYSVQM